MDKRYQVFVSSTYADLKNERQRVMQTLMEMDCIPAGMELFPAADEEQWEFIKKIIDDCDYYLLIIAGRYGSLTSDGISYTEKEFDYAVEKGIRVVALIHKEPSKITSGNTDQDATLKKQLEEFKKKVCTGRMVKFWSEANELSGLVALSLNKAIKTYPAVGWVRADKAARSEVLEENLKLKEKLEKLSKAVSSTRIERKSLQIENLADMNAEFTINAFGSDMMGEQFVAELTAPLIEIFHLISPFLQTSPKNGLVSIKLASRVFEGANQDIPYRCTLREHDLETLGVQFEVYGWSQIQKDKCVLLPEGRKVMLEGRALRG